MTRDERTDPSAAADAGDHWLEQMLVADGHASRETYIEDGGFSARVMRALPAAVSLPAWRKPAVAVLWGAAAAGLALAMPAVFVEVAREVYRLLATQPVSLSGIAGTAVAMVALTGAAAAYTLRTGN